VLPRATTICGGIAIALCLPRPVEPARDVGARQAVPAATAPQASAAPYEQRWTTLLEPDAAVPSLVLAPDRVILAGRDGALEARAIDTGQAIWSHSGSLSGPLAVGSGRIAGTAGGEVRAVGLQDGRPLWSIAIGEDISGLAIDAEVLFVTAGSEVRAHRMDGGAVVWTQPLDAPASLPPLPAGSMVVVASGGRLAAFSRETGRPVWRTALDAPALAMAAGADTLVLGTADGFPCAVDLTDGDVAWCFRTTPVPAAGRPHLAGDRAYFALLDNTVRAFHVPGGTLARLERLPARPVSGPLRAGTHLAVPLATAAFALLPLEGSQPVVVVPTVPPADQKVEAAGATPDGAWLVSLSIDLSGRQSLTGFGRTQPAPAPPPK
jgi:hypothetical protein